MISWTAKMLNRADMEISRHALIRALERGITPDLVERTLLSGRQCRFGKNYIKFIGKNIICVGEIKGLKIKILTIERK